MILSVHCKTYTLDARGLLVRQRRGASERVVLVGERPLAQGVKSFERADPITLPFISPESKFDPGNLIGRSKKRFLKGLLLVKCVMILAKPVLPKRENKRLRMSIKGNRRRRGSEVVIRWCQRFFFSPLRDSTSPLNSVAPNEKKTSDTQGIRLKDDDGKCVRGSVSKSQLNMIQTLLWCSDTAR